MDVDKIPNRDIIPHKIDDTIIFSASAEMPRVLARDAIYENTLGCANHARTDRTCLAIDQGLEARQPLKPEATPVKVEAPTVKLEPMRPALAPSPGAAATAASSPAASSALSPEQIARIAANREAALARRRAAQAAAAGGGPAGS